VPTCFVTLSEDIDSLAPEVEQQIRAAVARGLDSRARRLDYSHVVLRELRGRRASMLGDVEIEVFAHLFLPRFFSRDKRAKQIAAECTQLLEKDCACWINLGIVGYARVTIDGSTFFSD